MKLGLSLMAGRRHNGPWWPDNAVYAADFANDQYMRDGALVGRATALSFSRSTPKLAEDSRTIWHDFDIDAPALTDRGVVLEAAASNSVPNAAMTGAIVGLLGAGGALPDGWSNSGFASIEVIASGTEGGLPFVELRLRCDNDSGDTQFPRLICAEAIAANLDEHWSASSFYRRIAGTWPTATGAFLNVQELGASTRFATVDRAGDMTARTRLAVSWTTASLGAIELEMRLLMFTIAAGETADVTARFYAPVLEQADAASSPIITATGRGEDQLTCHLPLGDKILTWVDAGGAQHQINTAETDYRLAPGAYRSLTARPAV